MSNLLKFESSPYLLQHAENPVHWMPWNEAALNLAKQQNKLIIVSIGYSACHWCHVMEHETFEDADAAEVMNQSFINIKVDREERPDLDAVYMKSVQIMTGRGGWPMNVVTLPDGRPVWGGTYFRKQEWMDTLDELRLMYQSQPEKLIEYADKLQQAMNSISLTFGSHSADPLVKKETTGNDPLLEPLAKWKRSFDYEYGGMARAPKFMMPSNYQFLMRYANSRQDDQLMNFVTLTLDRMAWGGLFDTVGGGFSRYSVDMRWHVPHFEKMLYDNAQLISLYANAFKLTQKDLYREVVLKTIAFLKNELSNGLGAFYAAYDADSLNAGGILEEGAFYVWTQNELQSLLGDDFPLFSTVFNINNYGHWEHGNYVLIQSESLEDIARSQNIPYQTLSQKKREWESILFNARLNRPRPRLDDKCLTSWNAMTITAFIDAYNALGDESFLESAIECANFIRKFIWQPDGALMHTYKNGVARINGYLEDYAHLISALLSLYQATFDESCLQDARQLADYCLENFYDQSSGFFSFTSKADPALVSAHYETEDNVIPASNSVMAANLHKLGILFSIPMYTNIAENMTRQILTDVDYASAFSNWMLVHLDINEGVQLAVTGSNLHQKTKAIRSTYLPHLLIAGTETSSEIPFLKDKSATGTDQYFVCKDQSCSLPITDAEIVLHNLSATNVS